MQWSKAVASQEIHAKAIAKLLFDLINIALSYGNVQEGVRSKRLVYRRIEGLVKDANLSNFAIGSAIFGVVRNGIRIVWFY